MDDGVEDTAVGGVGFSVTDWFAVRHARVSHMRAPDWFTFLVPVFSAQRWGRAEWSFARVRGQVELGHEGGTQAIVAANFCKRRRNGSKLLGERAAAVSKSIDAQTAS